MGIVVSGEDGTMGASKEKQKLKLLVSENDYGLAMATLDQVSMFVASWWTRSLGSRIQVRNWLIPLSSFGPLINTWISRPSKAIQVSR